MVFPSWGIYVLNNEKAPDDRSFFQWVRYQTSGKKKLPRKLHKGRRKKLSQFFKFCKNDFNLAVDTNFWAWSNFNSFTNVGPSMVNDGALESSYQGEVILGYLAGDRDNYTNKVLVQGKQIVSVLYITYLT